MRISSFILIVVLFLCAASGFAQDRETLARTLGEHGVSTQPQALSAFLDKGWRAARPPNPLPKDPPDKSTLLIQAWLLLSLRYEEVQVNPAQGPYLSALALRYAQGDFPPDVQQMIDRDALAYDPALRETVLANLKRLMRYNGMVALGVFGRDTPETRRAARAIYDAEKSPLARVSYARTMGFLGDETILRDLVEAIRRAERSESVAATQVIYVLLGQSFGLHVNQAVGPRRKSAQEIVDWWNDLDKSTIQIDRQAALSRYMYRPPSRNRPTHSLRDLLRASADKADVADKRNSRTAWSQLTDMARSDEGVSLGKHLESILDNVDEDLDIRIEAVRWYFEINEKKKATKRLKPLLDDPNPEVVAFTRRILEPPE